MKFGQPAFTVTLPGALSATLLGRGESAQRPVIPRSLVLVHTAKAEQRDAEVVTIVKRAS